MKGPVLLLLLVGLAGSAASAAPIYRCGNTYSQMRCTDGQVLESTDPRSAAQRAEARRVAERLRLDAARMEAERREREAAMKPAVASGFDSRASEPAKVSEPKDSKRKSAGRKGKKEDRGSTQQDGKNFVAVEPRGR